MLAPLSIGRTMGLVGLLDLEAAAERPRRRRETARMQGVDYQLYLVAVDVRVGPLGARRDGSLRARLGRCAADGAAARRGQPDDPHRPRQHRGALRIPRSPRRRSRRWSRPAATCWSGPTPRGRPGQPPAADPVGAALATAATTTPAAGPATLDARAARLGILGSRARGRLTARAGWRCRAGDPRARAVLARGGPLRAAVGLSSTTSAPASVEAARVAAAARSRRRPDGPPPRRRRRRRAGAIRLHDAAARELRRCSAREAFPPEARRRATDGAGGSGAQRIELAHPARARGIAELVAQGQANKQVAATLFLGEKTIEHHLSRVYAKVGVRSRAPSWRRRLRARPAGRSNRETGKRVLAWPSPGASTLWRMDTRSDEERSAHRESLRPLPGECSGPRPAASPTSSPPSSRSATSCSAAGRGPSTSAAPAPPRRPLEAVPPQRLPGELRDEFFPWLQRNNPARELARGDGRRRLPISDGMLCERLLRLADSVGDAQHAHGDLLERASTKSARPPAFPVRAPRRR